MTFIQASSWSSTVLDLAIRATAWLAFVLSVRYFLRRRHASLGAAVGNAGLIGLLLLPLATFGLPSMPVACLPSNVSASRTATAFVSLPLQETSLPLPRFEDAFPLARTEIPASLESSAVKPADVPQLVLASPESPSGKPTESTPAPEIDWSTLAISGYAVMVLIFLARLAFSWVAVSRLKSSSTRLDDAAWSAALERGRRTLGINRDVALAWSPRVCVPVVLGFFRPIIVLPTSLTGSDSREYADAVLLHELSHVRRNDYPWNLLLRFVQAIYWPHLLVWVLGRTIAEDRERACDDLCIHELGGPAVYKDTLLAVASGMIFDTSPALGLAMARTSKLSRRLAQIDRSVGDGRCLPRWPARLAITVTAVMLAVVIGAIQLVRAEAHATTLDDTPKAVKAAETAKAGRVFHLLVVAADTGAPVPEADVRVWIAFRDYWLKTDAQGRLDIPHSTVYSDRNFGIDVWGKGRAMQRYNWGLDPRKPIPDGETIKLQPGESLGGVVQDEREHPIAGATVYLWSHNYKRKDSHELLYDLRAVTGLDGKWQTSGAPETTGELLGIQVVHPDFLSTRDYYTIKEIPKIADLRAGNAATVMTKGVPIEGRVVDARGKPVAGVKVISTDYPGTMATEANEFAVMTDAAGQFRTGQVKPGDWHLIGLAQGHGPGVRTVKIGTAVPQVEITLPKPHVLKGRVVDPEGKPLAGAFVNVDAWRGYRCLGAFLWTDDGGRFQWDEAPEGEFTVNVDLQGYRGLFMQRATATGEDFILTLKPSLSVSGKLTDAETKKRVDNAKVEYSEIDPKTGEPRKWTSMPEVGSGTGVYQGELNVNFPITADVYKIRVQSPGYKTFMSRSFRREEKVVLDYNISIKPGVDTTTGKVATVLRPDGKPLADARLFEVRELGGVTISDGVTNPHSGSGVKESRTTPDGTFGIPEDDKPWFLFILGDGFYAQVGKEDLKKSPKVQAKPYAQIQGRYLIGTRPVANKQIDLSGDVRDDASSGMINLEQRTISDADGRFSFKNVVPDSNIRVTHKGIIAAPGTRWSIGDAVRVNPGETAEVTLGGKGRPIIGRVERPENWAKPIDFTVESVADIESDLDRSYEPMSLLRGKTSLGAEWNDWMRRSGATPEARQYAARRVSIGLGLAPDGTFRIDDILPGRYRLSIRVNGEASFYAMAGNRGPGPFERIVQTFTVPPIPGGRTDEPLNLGVFRLRPRVELTAGEPAPPFDFTTVNGKKLAIPGDFKGKYLLLDFSTLWDSQSGIQITRLNDVQQRFGDDPRFAILSVTLAADTPATRKYIADKGETWPQAILGPLSNPVTLAYRLDDENVPAAILIGPDGKVISGFLYYNKIGEAVGAALGRAGKK